HECLDSTLTILQHRLKAKGDRPAIKVFQSYGCLPPVFCYPGQMNQVFMNILANAIDALEEAMNQGKVWEPEIKIITQLGARESVVIEIADNALGIPESIRDRLFEPLFTTKAVGKGTGLGLAIAHQILTEKHQGRITVQSQLGRGTTFAIEIPCGDRE
ncbi:MAG: HAMP domain-containing histidine kinase, partial [Okeania sp. SIO2H7]|nr:HAMP domain-containing histidine kinase [Okeania sp. SIO2H7]